MVDENPYASFEDDRRSSPYRSARTPQTTSVMAVLSLISGLLSYPMMCLCFLSIPFSIFAIVTGHIGRANVKQSGGAVSGGEMAIFGMICGYSSFVLTATMMFYMLGQSNNIKVGTPPAAVNQGTTLLEQAETQLLVERESTASGTSTSEHDATALAAHFVETLQIVDQAQFEETNPDVPHEARAYRTFVQLNEDSAVFLLYVPEFQRFTDAAKDTLCESCWLIAQRSVDDLLAEGDGLAVALYSDTGCERRMIGSTKRRGEATAGMEATHGTSQQLAEFFKLPDRPLPKPLPETAELDSQIDNKAAPGELTLPAEAD